MRRRRPYIQLEDALRDPAVRHTAILTEIRTNLAVTRHGRQPLLSLDALHHAQNVTHLGTNISEPAVIGHVMGRVSVLHHCRVSRAFHYACTYLLVLLVLVLVLVLPVGVMAIGCGSRIGGGLFSLELRSLDPSRCCLPRLLFS
jgi:hypothetical protein